MTISDWLSNNWIEIFGALAGIIYVFLEIRQNIWLWPVGIVTSAVYIIVFFTSKFYADMSLQVYYLVISIAGWFWWIRGGRRQAAGGRRKEMGKAEGSWLPSLEGVGVGSDGTGQNSPLEGGRALKNDPVNHFSEGARLKGEGDVKLKVTHLKLKTGLILSVIFILLYFLMWFVLSRFTDSPVPEWDSFITSLSIIATLLLARKIYEHWFLWIVVNSASVILFLTRGLYPTVILYMVYLVMSFVGLKEWKRSL
jgi:nicotinamide mononucleotide transporter